MRIVIAVLALNTIFLARSHPAHAGDAAFKKQTLVFKKVGDLAIEADVYRPADDKVRPVVVWQNGLWTKEVTGFDPADKKSLDPFCPVRNITPQFPPSLMIHGTKDNDVPFELSANMAKEFARHKVQHELVAIEGAWRAATRA